MIVSRQRYEDALLHIDGDNIEKVTYFKYLETMFVEKWDCNQEVKICTRLQGENLRSCNLFYLQKTFFGFETENGKVLRVADPAVRC